MAQTPLHGIKTLKSGGGWDHSMDGTVEEPHTPPQRLFGGDEDVEQEEYDPEDDSGSFVEEDTVLGGPPRGDEDECGNEVGLREGEGVVLPRLLDFTTVRKGADSPDENEDDYHPPKSSPSATPSHSASKSPGAAVPLSKVDIPLERFVVGLAHRSSCSL
jgi:hypothetical protein